MEKDYGDIANKKFYTSKCPMMKTEASSKSSVRGFVSDNPQLPKWEIAFYLVAMVSIITYAGYGFYVTYGSDMSKNLKTNYLLPGWLRTYKDGIVEPLFEKATNNWKQLILASMGYLVVSKASLAALPLTSHYLACSAYTIAMLSLAVSMELALALLLVVVVNLCLAYFSSVFSWLFAIFFMLSLNNTAATMDVLRQLKIDYGSIFTFSAIYGYLLCRLISVCSVMHTEVKQQAVKPSFFDYLIKNMPKTLYYVFYMPYTWCGPILTYETFCKGLELRGNRVKIDAKTARLVGWRACRMVLWYFVLELIHHNLPVGSYLLTLNSKVPIVYKHLSFAMYLHGQNFMLLYVQYYGWPAALAQLDGIQLYHWPDCISAVYSYSIMWRVFDRGLFAFLQTHLYTPLGGSRHGLLRQILALSMVFAFICIFHSNSYSVCVWVTLNFLQLLAERLAVAVYYKQLRSTVTRYLSPQNEKRLIGYAIAWNMMVSMGTIFFLLIDTSSFIIFKEFLQIRSIGGNNRLWHMLTVQFGTYCGVQIGRYYEVKLPPVVLRRSTTHGSVHEVCQGVK